MDDSEQHLVWISKAVQRILHASSSSAPLLSFSFARILPVFAQISHLSVPITFTTLSNGNHYALITSVLAGTSYENRSPSFQFETILNSLNLIGFKPQPPCTPSGLMSSSLREHVNLCEAIEFAVFDKSLSIEKFLDDVRRIPRSFFVLREYPSHIEGAISLWLSKFPCIVDLPEVTDLQLDVSTGKHVAAVLSRTFPHKINKITIINSNNYENWENAKEILNELGAFIPLSFPLSNNLFMCFISDLFYATRSAVKKFVRIDLHNNVPLSLRPTTTVRQYRGGPSSKAISDRPKTCPTAFRPSPRLQKPITVARDDESDLTQLFSYMRRGDRKEKFVEVDNPTVIIKPLCKIINLPQHEQTFSIFWKLIENAPLSQCHYMNCHAFLNALSGNNNEFAASRRIVYFARTMMQSYVAVPNAAMPAKIGMQRRTKRQIMQQRSGDRIGKVNSIKSDPMFLKVYSKIIETKV